MFRSFIIHVFHYCKSFIIADHSVLFVWLLKTITYANYMLPYQLIIITATHSFCFVYYKFIPFAWYLRYWFLYYLYIDNIYRSSEWTGLLLPIFAFSGVWGSKIKYWYHLSLTFNELSVLTEIAYRNSI